MSSGANMDFISFKDIKLHFPIFGTKTHKTILGVKDINLFID